MRLTRQHLYDAYPTLSLLGRSLTDTGLRDLLAMELGAFTLNQDYASDMATVLMSHIANGLYSDLPAKLVAFRATVDIFFELMTEERAPMYLRSVAMALHYARRPAVFRRHLCARANSFRLVVPKHLYDQFGETRFSAFVKLRLPSSLVSEIKVRAQAQGSCLSEYIREAIYTRVQSEGSIE